jgi:cytochrome c peroxidase
LFCSSLNASEILGLPPVPVPDANPQSTGKVELGRLLFNDKRFSADGTISCASCHKADLAFTDGLPVAKGINQQIGNRNAPTVVNSVFYETFFHDGRAASLEEQALGPFTNPIEHGLKDHQFIVDIVSSDTNYRKRFKDVFGLSANNIEIGSVTMAIASFERTLIAGNSPFDQFFFGRNKSAISASAARGSRVFRRKGNCANCHEISWNNALFTDNRFYNIGVGFGKLKPEVDAILIALQQGKSLDLLQITKDQKSELGRFNVTRVIDDIGRFKTPTLRNIALTGPYMHDGSIKTLAEVVEYYDKGGEKNRFLDPAIFPLKLTEQEKKDLVAFMKSLTSPEYTSEDRPATINVKN